MTFFRKCLHGVSYLTLALSIALIIIIFYYLFWPVGYITVKNTPFPILNANHVVKRGELLTHTVDYCKTFDYPAETSRRFINDLIYTTPIVITNNPPGCHVLNMTVLVPRELPPGIYYLEITKVFKINPLRTIIQTYRTEKFTVI